MQHDIFGHAIGEIRHGDAHQRHVGQALVGHQRIDAGAQIEDRTQIGERAEIARHRLPHRGIVHFGRIEPGVGQQHHAAAAADRVEPGLPALRQPVLLRAVDQDGQCAHAHSKCLVGSVLKTLLGTIRRIFLANFFRSPVGAGHIGSS
ncbi:hypothetical protein ABIF67_006469 [Bradyrhizobium japonicum]